MDIQNLRLRNFASYRGPHQLDFSSDDTGRHSYAVFGDIGRGKTSLVHAIHWCLYGSVEVTMEIGGEMKTRDRPIVDEDQFDARKGLSKWNPPLLTDAAWLDGEYDMAVSIIFKHEGSRWELHRHANRRRGVTIPRKNSDMEITANLVIDQKPVRANAIQSRIEEVMPREVIQFFFIEGDSVKKYAGLVFSDQARTQLESDVESILGLPALVRSMADFRDKSQEAEKALGRLQRKESKDRRTNEDIDRKEEHLKEVEAGIKDIEARIEGIIGELEEVEAQLQEMDTAKDLLEDLARKREELTKARKTQSRLYESRRKVAQNLWLAPLQPQLMVQLDKEVAVEEERTKLNRDLFVAKQRQRYATALANSDPVACESCGLTPPSPLPHELERHAAEALRIESEIEGIRRELERIGEGGDRLSALSRFRDPSSGTALAEVEGRLKQNQIELRDLERKEKRIELALQSHNEIAVQNLVLKRTKLIGERHSQRDLLDDVQRVRAELRQELTGLRARLVRSDSQASRMVKSKIELLTWLEATWQKALAEYLETTRRAVGKHASSTFLKLIPEPERYSGLDLTDHWGLSVKAKDGRNLVIGNPGHRHTVAVSLFDALRTVSKIRFPTVFDNPGAAIDKETTNRMAELFWTNPQGQFIILSHSGGLEEEAALARYGSILAKAWRVSYEGDEGTYTRIEEI